MTDLIYAHCAIRATSRPRVTGRWPRVPGGDAPRALPVGHGLWIIVSTVPASDYDEQQLAVRLADPEWVALCGMAHHEVIARAARGHAVAPFRLLTLFRSDARVTEEAETLRSTIEQALDRVGDRREWVIRVVVSRPRAAARARSSSGTSYLMARAAESQGRLPTPVARRAARALVKEAGQYADRLIQRESAAAHLVYDGALLVSRSREHDLSVAVRRWARRLVSVDCRVSLTGPWPPYSFVSLERERVHPGA